MSIKDNTVEGLIESLDQRGLLVFLVLLGQQAMKLLTEEKVREFQTPRFNKLITTDAKDIRALSKSVEG